MHRAIVILTWGWCPNEQNVTGRLELSHYNNSDLHVVIRVRFQIRQKKLKVSVVNQILGLLENLALPLSWIRFPTKIITEKCLLLTENIVAVKKNINKRSNLYSFV